MNHFKKIAGVLETHSLDAVLLTCEANRFYASGFSLLRDGRCSRCHAEPELLFH